MDHEVLRQYTKIYSIFISHFPSMIKLRKKKYKNIAIFAYYPQDTNDTSFIMISFAFSVNFLTIAILNYNKCHEY